MAEFKVSINFSTTVSEKAADDLECLVSNFVQGILNVVANDEYDQVASEIANDLSQSGDVIPIDDPAHYWAHPIFVPDEGSDAPVEYNGATDFDRR
jgi:hypothetical protein